MSEIIIGCGVDIIEIERIANALKRPRFKTKIYTENEQDLLATKKIESWAARFAAKEAVMKALGFGWRGGIKFTDIDVSHDHLGKPVVKLSGKTKELAEQSKVTKIHLSLSHDRSVAIAYAIAVGEV